MSMTSIDIFSRPASSAHTRDSSTELAWEIAGPGDPRTLNCVEVPAPGRQHGRVRNEAIRLNPVDWS
jgi:hypothetical protein